MRRTALARVRDAALTGTGLALFGLMGLAWTPLALLLRPLLPGRTAHLFGRWANRRGFQAYLWVLQRSGACRFDLSALDALRGQGPLIVAPNHPSLIDAVLLISRLPGLSCVMKSSLLGNPMLGAGARLAGYIGNEDLRRMVELAVAELRGGGQLLFFPEGTRSEQTPIGPVTGMVGLIAKRAGVAVQTVLIESDSDFLGKRWSPRDIPRLPVRYRVRLGPRLQPPADAQEFVAQLDASLRQALLRETASVAAPPARRPHDDPTA